jgi:multimeric flavodoxin WrbA
MIRVLGLSASLRSARHGRGAENLPEELESIPDRDALTEYLKHQTHDLLEAFEEGRKRDLPFDRLYAELKKRKGLRGLSNSEASVAAGLWGAQQEGAEVRYVDLQRFFPESGRTRHLAELKKAILWADGFLLATPVYFGDRSSLAQAFVEFLYQDDECLAHVRDKVFGGIAVGAKRNGGQETTLVYQLIDMINLNMLGVGNDSASTSQYGGTVVAGDVGTMAKDDYGIATSVDTGRRVAMMSDLLARAEHSDDECQTKVAVWFLQDDASGRGAELVQQFCEELARRESGVSFEIRNFTDEQVHRCIACDICPIGPGVVDDYRCIVSSERDLFARLHRELVDVDAILLAAYSPTAKKKLHSVYQRFIERTRYLRRDDYAVGDLLTAPLVFSEINSNQNLHIRMSTSLIRHHSVLHHPLLGFELNREIINWDHLLTQGSSFVRNAARLTRARMQCEDALAARRQYNPLGYVIAAEKKREFDGSSKHEQTREARAMERNARRRRKVG